MRLSSFFFKTEKQPPADAAIISHQLLEQAGFIQKIAPGIYVSAPLMFRVLEKVSAIIKKALDEAGCQEMQLPYLQPKELWDQTGRFEAFRQEKLLYSLEDRNNNTFCIAPTCEEVVVDAVSKWVSSYKKLPFCLYQIGAKFRDEIRPRFGLMRCKEFLMHDGYSFGANVEQMQQQYQKMREAYTQIFDTLKLNYVIVKAHSGKIGKGRSEEFQVLAESGEDGVFIAEDLAFNQEYAKAICPSFTYDTEVKPLEKAATPGVCTIESLAAFFKTEPQKILKTLVFKLLFEGKSSFVAIGVRGDRQVNPLKVQDYFEALEIEPASEKEILELGSLPGFIGPLGLEIPFYADFSCEPMQNFICGCNEKDVHMCNVNFSDCEEIRFHDFLLAEQGDLCPENNAPYEVLRGIEVGHIFELGSLYSEKMGATFQDAESQNCFFEMGTYGIGIGRTAQAIVEQNHDDKGIIWPFCVAPFHFVIIAASASNEALVQEAEQLYSSAQKKRLEPLFDDRNERMGLKLKESDLIGIPYKVIIGKSFEKEGCYEVETRLGEKHFIPHKTFIDWLIKQESFQPISVSCL